MIADDAQASLGIHIDGSTMDHNGIKEVLALGSGGFLGQAPLPSRDLSKQWHSESLSRAPGSWQGARVLGWKKCSKFCL